MSIRPLYGKVVIEVTPEEEITTSSGIVISTSTAEANKVGKVVAVGTGYPQPDGTTKPLSVKEGDTVLFGAAAGTEIDDSTIIIKQECILGVRNVQ